MNCLVCSEQDCVEERCEKILLSIEEIKQEESVIEQYLKELWP